MLPKIDNEESELAAWSIKGPSYRRPNTPFLDALEERAETLTAVGWDNVDPELALFAVKAYARRNYIAHGKGADLHHTENSKIYPRLSGEAFRSSVDVGRFRIKYPEGLPPPKVSFSPSSLRRHTVSEPWWTLKRPGTE